MVWRVAVYVDHGTSGRYPAAVGTERFFDEASARHYAENSLLDIYLTGQLNGSSLFWCELAQGLEVKDRWEPIPSPGGLVDSVYLGTNGEITWDLAASAQRRLERETTRATPNTPSSRLRVRHRRPERTGECLDSRR